MAEEVERCLARGRKIHRDLLRPLFFGTLNRPWDLRSRAAKSFGPIPFLNGGLFEPHPLERRFRADIPNTLWRETFDRLFERFHFTVYEGSRHAGVAPDMLGRVFEGVMAPDVRHASGTFYTPASLVGSVLDASLIALIGERLGRGDRDAERHFKARDPGTAGSWPLSPCSIRRWGRVRFSLAPSNAFRPLEPAIHCPRANAGYCSRICLGWI